MAATSSPAISSLNSLTRSSTFVFSSSEKTLNELKDQVSEDEKTKVEGLVGELRELIAGDDVDAIKAKSDELSNVIQEIGAKIYQQAQAEAQAQQQAGADPNAGAADGDEIGRASCRERV